VKDVTPFPDQDLIRADVARHKYRSRIDMSDIHEQIRHEPADIRKSYYATVNSVSPNETRADPYDFSETIEVEWLVDDIIGHQWNGRRITFHIL
jgi:hypothetical protein